MLGRKRPRKNRPSVMPSDIGAALSLSMASMNFIHRQDRQPFAIAGLWEQWVREDTPSVLSCTLLTTAANRFVQQLHTRMPAILLEADEAAWVDPSQQRTEALRALLRPAPEEWLSAYPVSRRVNAPKHDDVQCIEP